STVRVFDVRTWREVATLRGHGKPVAYLAISRDGARLASAGLDEVLCLWDLRVNQLERTIPLGSAPLKPPALSPDGSRVFVNLEGVVGGWDAGSGRPIAPEKRIPYAPLAFSPDGRSLAVLSTAVLLLCDAQTGQVLTYSAFLPA